MPISLHRFYLVPLRPGPSTALIQSHILGNKGKLYDNKGSPLSPKSTVECLSFNSVGTPSPLHFPFLCNGLRTFSLEWILFQNSYAPPISYLTFYPDHACSYSMYIDM